MERYRSENIRDFAVCSSSFSKYRKFKAECLLSGWSYNKRFGYDKFSVYAMKRNDCLYFSDVWEGVEGKPMFAFSNVEGVGLIFNLDTEVGYKEAIKYMINKNETDK
jgi:hypothetical protein